MLKCVLRVRSFMLKVETWKQKAAALPERNHIPVCCRLCRGLAFQDSRRVSLKCLKGKTCLKGKQKVSKGREIGNGEDFFNYLFYVETFLPLLIMMARMLFYI